MNEGQKIARIAAGLAISNFGFGHGNEIGKRIFERLTEAPRSAREVSDQAGYEICNFAGHLLESEEHEKIFIEEAESWEKQIKKMGLEKYVAQKYLQSSNYDWIRSIMAMT